MAIIQNLEAFVQSYPAGLETVTDMQLSQNENGRQLRFKIGGLTIPAGSVATISGTKPDGVVYSKTGTIEGADTVIFDEDVQMTAVFGTWYAKIRIINAGNTIASARVRFIIDKDPVDAGAIPSESELDGLVTQAEEYAEAAKDSAEKAAITYGSPLTASTASAMTNVNRVYVYTGSESGYTYGNWYYYNGSAWVSGGVYNSAAVETDTTLTEPGVPADAKETGDEIAALKDDLTLTDNNIDSIVAIGNIVKSSVAYILGTYNLTNGSYTPPSNPNQSTVCVDSEKKAFRVTSNTVTMSIASGFRYRCVILNPDLTFNSYVDWTTSANPSALQNKKGYYLKPIVAKSDGGTITKTDVETYGTEKLSIICPIETPIAKKYSSSATYRKGEYCIYDSNLYRCISAITTAEAWTASHWALTSVSAEMQKDNQNIEQTVQKLNDLIGGKITDQWSTGYMLGTYNLSTGAYTQPSNPAKSASCVDAKQQPFMLYSDTITLQIASGFRVRCLILNDDLTVDSYSDWITDSQPVNIQNHKGYYLKPIVGKSDGSDITIDEVATYGADILRIVPGSAQSPYKLAGKVVVNFGDSIFGKNRPPHDVSTKISELTGATIYNIGFGGTRISKPSNANWAAFSMYELAKSISTDDYSTQDNVDVTTAGFPDYFADTLQLLESIDFSKVDIITLAYGTNDFSGDAALEISNLYSSGTYGGAIRYVLETLWTAYPNLEIVLCTPTYRFWLDSQGDFIDDSDTRRNGQNLLLTDYVAKMQTLANDYHVTCIDNYYKLGINKFNRSNWFPANDGTHHNYAGACLIAEHIANELF